MVDGDGFEGPWEAHPANVCPTEIRPVVRHAQVAFSTVHSLQQDVKMLGVSHQTNEDTSCV
jgi:hypothetical protein